MGVLFDCMLPEWFEDPAAEYRCARETVALFDVNYYSVVRFTGPDHKRYLNAVLTNDIQSLRAGAWNSSLLLNPQGHILAEIDVLAEPERMTAVFHRMVHTGTIEILEKYIIMDDVTLEDVTQSVASFALLGPAADGVLAELGVPDVQAMPANTHSEVMLGAAKVHLVKHTMEGLPFLRLFTERERAWELWQQLREVVRAKNGAPCGYQAWNALRLEAGVPWFGYDFSDKYIPHEAALENTHVSLSKGCYTGQEIVERVRSRGHVNRRRVGLEFGGTAVPEAGTSLFADGKEAGNVTSAAHSYLLGRPIGMGYVRRDALQPRARLESASGIAQVIELPLPSLRRVSA